MAELAEALEMVKLAADRSRQDAGSLDTVLNTKYPRKRQKISLPTLGETLEKEFLEPPASFSVPWLNELQQRWDKPTDIPNLFEIVPTQTRTIIRFTREGLEGRVTGYKELTVPAKSATAKNSTSLLRKPANRAEFVRGAAGFFPFTPGGLDGVDSVAATEDLALQHASTAPIKSGGNLDRVISVGTEGSLLEVPPGFSRGMRTKVAPAHDQKDADEVQRVLQEEPEPTAADESIDLEATSPGPETKTLEEDENVEDIDALLPVEFPALSPHKQLRVRDLRGKEWAHMVDVDKPIPNFSELVPDMAREWPFELDTFQKEAVYHLENGDSVFVAAHTSAGKTVVAEYAIALAAKHMTKAIYTSPIKALSNQKFRDFRNVFDDVGILTGDVQIRPEASCLIMTTEILRSMLYRGADIIRDVEFVIFDEVHYVNDQERGVVWEEVIIMLPEHVTLILLSATVPNTQEFASWVGRTKKKDIYVISTLKRPVPLEHYLWAGKQMFKIVNADKEFIVKGWRAANDVLSGKNKPKVPDSTSSRGDPNQRGTNRGQGGRGGQRGGGQQSQRARGQSSSRGNIARTGRGGGRTTAAQDRNVWVELVHHLRKGELLPACIFVFSKKRCEENADALSSINFCTADEKSSIHMIIERSVARLKPEDRLLPQILRQRELLSRGIAVHHGGMLPILKEVVEILFAKTLVKVLFATETFAMGLNLPTRTVVFSGFRKHDGKSFRDLTPGEYTQMAGRAGRRGLDTVGTVILVTQGSDEAPPQWRLDKMMLGQPTKLRSQFRLTYNMILNLLRVEALKIEEMIKRSFSENASQALLPEQEKQMELTEADLKKIKREPCEICDIDLEACHQACMNYQRLTTKLHLAALESHIGRRRFTPKRLIVYKKDGVRTIGMLTREGFLQGAEPTVPILELPVRRKKEASDLLPFVTGCAAYFAPLPQKFSDLRLRTAIVPVRDIECVTETTITCDKPLKALNEKKEIQKLAQEQFGPLTASWNLPAWDEHDWREIKDLSFQAILDDREKEVAAMKGKCLTCPKFLEHFAKEHDEWLLKENILQLRQLMSDQNLQLLPDYEQRIAVLKDLGFVDEHSRVELKGKVACEIHTADELVLTELILENVLADYEPEEIVALLSAFVFQEKSSYKANLTPKLETGQSKIIQIVHRVNQVQEAHQVVAPEDKWSVESIEWPHAFGMIEVVYEWARGMPFNRITDLTDVMEGTIVRVITRLDETCREVKNAARIIGDPSLYQKMQTCQELIKRDVCATASLYM
ncbi:antiviral helicase [Trichodelitschia bisporula]|uniref:Antiviral helicase n=1 Tax=Trichodelitschia bisporula TaxID=703511 RepID=A0A6G1HJG7_9PEZI|nr:antiviral helicase [Trichodelitschia bisporula]